jgi:hypothetical protein
MESGEGSALWSFLCYPEKDTETYLLQRAVDTGKLGIKVRTETVNHGDDGQRDTSCDQAIFNGGGARFIGKKTQQNPLQYCLLKIFRVESFNGIRIRPEFLRPC